MRAAVLSIAISVSGCAGDVDAPWQLDHDRIIAVRATPPRIVAGERAELDVLIGRAGAAPAEEMPSTVEVISPATLAGALTFDAGRWVVTAPDDLRSTDPVPLIMRVEAGGFTATKTVWLGDAADNPVIATAAIDGVEAAAAQELVVARDVDVPLSVDFAETDDVNWLTSCGEMHDYDLPQAYLRVEPDDGASGELAVVVRTPNGGVTWRVWSIHAE